MAAIAILGATGHVGQGLAFALGRGGMHDLLLYARRPQRASDFLARHGLTGEVHDIADFGIRPFDAVINVVGAGDPSRIQSLGAGIFRLTERFDNAVLDVLAGHPERLYLNLSSGAAYGSDFARPVGPDSRFYADINHLPPGAAYGLAKLNAEAKHRAHGQLNIVDLRLFSYFSRFIDLTGRFFMAELARSLVENVPFATNRGEMDRDYVIPDDLARMAECCLERWAARDGAPINGALDFYSRAPAGKFELIEAVRAALPLRVEVIGEESMGPSTGGAKSRYFSENRMAESWGYAPRFSSVEGVVAELRALLQLHDRRA